MRKLTAVTVAVVAMLLLAAGCYGQTEAERQGSQAQERVLDTAMSAVPPYEPTSFPGREAINKSLRADEQGPWYVYALAFDGSPLFHITSEFRPYNKCHSITSPQRITKYSGGDKSIGPAPALDGIYYSSGGCHTYVVEDVETGSIIDLSGSTFTIIASLRPLRLETDPLIANDS